jgi:hypothetical protein
MTSRSAVLAVAAIAALLGSAMPVAGQEPEKKAGTWALRSTSGGFIPTGDLRNTLKNASASGAQLSWAVHPAVSVTGSFNWATTRDLSMIDAPKLDVFTSDVGLELCPKVWGDREGMTFHSFAAIGGGARSYNYRKLDVDATHNLAGYAGVGGELGKGRFGLRLEVRDYMAGFKPLMGAGKSEQRNDVVIMAGLRFNRRQS